MNVHELLHEVESRGVRVELVGKDRLRAAPAEKLTPQMVEELKATKEELLRILDGCPRCRRSRAQGVYVLMCSCGYESPQTRRRLAQPPQNSLQQTAGAPRAPQDRVSAGKDR